uniref:Uncharacterized protein n=1 Tax=uncultured prokaryote TaxID=198431 RepID=A0A0H5Q425_9ZZZZ|nr:hypothetical protein [uncultured prokaryote]
MPRKMYRTSRQEYQGCETRGEVLVVHVQTQTMQGPAGWVNNGPRGEVYVPITTLLRPDITGAMDKATRTVLSRLWTIEQEDGLF